MDNILKAEISNFMKEDEAIAKLANDDFMMIAMIGIVITSWEDYKKEHGL